jgi:predicted enzyme related to lactoylglutathione lyase
MNLNGILIGSEDPQRLTAYYTRLFGEPGWAGGDFRGWQLGTGHVTDVHGNFERLKAAGATVVQEPYQPGEAPEGWIATLADPDDNYFQLISPME